MMRYPVALAPDARIVQPATHGVANPDLLENLSPCKERGLLCGSKPPLTALGFILGGNHHECCKSTD